MALTFDLSMPPNSLVEFGQSVTFENFVGQFQKICPRILYVVDGVSLRHYDPTDPTANQSIPKNIRFEYKQSHDTFTEYYFRDIYTNQLYCVFNRDIAKTWYPRLDKVDPPNASPIQLSPISITQTKEIPLNQSTINQSTINQPKEIPLNQSKEIPLNQSMINKSKEIPITQSSMAQISIKQVNHPKIITIIDREKKLEFPYHNYPVEIRTYKYGD